MISAEPLFPVFTALALLRFVGARLIKINTPSCSPNVIPGEEIAPFLHVTGLDGDQRDELKIIISRGDELAMTKFNARYRPRFVELDNDFHLLRKRFFANLGKSTVEASDQEKIAAAESLAIDDHSSSFDFTVLSKPELRSLLECREHAERCINEDFMRRFGNAQFLENFYAYKELLRNNGCTLYIPKSDAQRPVLDLLAETGVVLKSRRIQLSDRLRILTLAQLNEMASKLKIREMFSTHEEAVQSLARTPGSAILLAMVYTVDDLFFFSNPWQ